MAVIRLAEMSLQVFSHGPWTEDEQVFVRRQAAGDLCDKPFEVLKAMRFTGILRASAAAVADHGIVPDMAGGATMRRHL